MSALSSAWKRAAKQHRRSERRAIARMVAVEGAVRQAGLNVSLALKMDPDAYVTTDTEMQRELKRGLS